MPTKREPKLTDAERHARFKEMASEVGASEDAKDFEQAVATVVEKQPTPARRIRAKR